MGITYAGQLVLSPNEIVSANLRDGLPIVPWFGQANSFRCDVGMTPGSGMVLLMQSQLSQISINQGNALTFNDGSNSLTLPNIIVRKWQSIRPGAASDPNNPYCVWITDCRWVFAGLPIDQAYNVFTDSTCSAYMAGTTNSGTPWTWQTMFASIWGQCPGLGYAPNLPWTPDGLPTGFVFYGSTVWVALGVVLDRLACALRYDPVKNVFSIVRLGEPDTVASGLLAALTTNRIWDDYSGESTYTRLPQYVRVLFQKSPTPTDGSSYFYSLSVADTSPWSGTLANSVVNLLDDEIAIYNSGTITNSAALSSRATERAADWFRRAKVFQQPMHRQYSNWRNGCVTAMGSTVFGFALLDTGTGFKTEVLSGPDTSESALFAVPGTPGTEGSSTLIENSFGGGSYYPTTYNNYNYNPYPNPRYYPSGYPGSGSGGSSTAPVWATIPESTSFTVLAPSTQWNYYECNGTGITATLPNPATTAAGTMFAVCNIGTPLVTVNLNGGTNFCSLGNEQFVILTLDNAGTGWDVISTNITDGATLTGTSFTQPAVNANVTVTVAQTNWMAKFSTLYIAGGGWYFVSSITNATTVVLTNIGVSTNAAAATVISAPVLVENIGADFTPFTPIAASSNFTAVGNTLTCNLYECSAAITATLPAVSASPKGCWVGFVNTGTSGTITVTAAGADKIGVAAYASITLTNKDDKLFLTPNQAGNGWDIVGDNRITQGSGVTLTRSASGIQVAASSVPGGGVWYGFELDYNSLQLTSIATNAATVALLVLPQYGALSRYASYVATVFAGSGLTSLTATCGDATNNTFLISTPFNFLNAGTVPQGINSAATNSLRSVTGTTQINLYLTANAGFQLKNLTAGKFWIWVEISAGVTPVAI